MHTVKFSDRDISINPDRVFNSIRYNNCNRKVSISVGYNSTDELCTFLQENMSGFYYVLSNYDVLDVYLEKESDEVILILSDFGKQLD